MRSVGVQRSRSLNRDRSTPSRPADANVDSAVAFDRIRLRSTIPIIDDRFMRDDVGCELETAGQESRGILTTVVLDVMRQLDQQLDDGATLILLVRRCGCRALNLGRQGRAQFFDGTFQRLQFLGRIREIRVVLHLLNNAAARCDELWIGEAFEPGYSSDLWTHDRPPGLTSAIRTKARRLVDG